MPGIDADVAVVPSGLDLIDEFFRSGYIFEGDEVAVEEGGLLFLAGFFYEFSDSS